MSRFTRHVGSDGNANELARAVRRLIVIQKQGVDEGVEYENIGEQFEEAGISHVETGRDP